MAHFVASASGAAALQLFHEEDVVELRADGAGARFTVAADGQVVVQQPEIRELKGTEACSEMQSFQGRVDEQRLLAVCRQRFFEDACQACLGERPED